MTRRTATYALLLVAVFSTLCFAQDKVFDWVRASDETVRLDPSDFHGGRVYRPGPNGGNMHVDIQAKQPVTVAMVAADEWNSAMQHERSNHDLNFRCLREHVVSTTYTCALPPARPMVLVIRDERNPSNAIVRSVGAILKGTGGARQFISPNDVLITYYRWNCVSNCLQPEFQWFRLVKEKYEITPVPKVYSVINPDHDGQDVNIRIKAGIPMLVTLVPSKDIDQVYSSPDSLQSIMSGSSCKQRGVQTLTFDCTANVADGPQALVLLPEAGANTASHKKAEIELQVTRCVANCNLLPAPKQQ
ncbi:MAG TPA: hypothetical protein VKW78_00895 [Terriglobales bacterium]|nr:hypothetical protein [Terriglobales bacterium]